jgi:hypothetical protein
MIYTIAINIIITAAILYLTISMVFYGNSPNLLPVIFKIVVLQGVLFSYAILIDSENKNLIMQWPFQIFIYRQIIAIITIKALIDYMRGRKASWNKLSRLGKNTLESI